MDIAQYEIKSGAQTLEILDPLTQKPTEIKIQVLSTRSKDFNKRSLEIYRAGLKKGDKVDVEKVKEDEAKIIAACIVGWSGIVISKKKFEYSPENAVELINRFPWIGEQIDKFAVDLKNFMKGSGKA